MRDLFLFCAFGLLAEVAFTGIYEALTTGFKTWKGHVSLLMILPYGIGYLLGTQIFSFFDITNTVVRIFSIVVIIYSLEYYFGSVYKHFGILPWKYDHKIQVMGIHIRLDVNGLISFAYLPLWIGFSVIALKIFL